MLGDDAGLSDGLKSSFRRSGLYHLLAVSGQNVVLIALGALGLVWLLGLPRAVGHIAALIAIGAYVLAVGPQPSVIRAAVSGIAVSVAWLAARERDPWHALLLAALVLLAWSPYTVFDPGFQLSFAAVARDLRRRRACAAVLEGYPVPPALAARVAVSAACSLATAPILWLRFGQVPLLGVVANALVEPVVGVLLGLGLVTAVRRPGRAGRGECPRVARTAGSPPTSPPARGWSQPRPSPRRAAAPPRWRARRARGAAYAWLAMADELQAGVPDRRQRPSEGRPRSRAAPQQIRTRRRRAARRCVLSGEDAVAACNAMGLFGSGSRLVVFEGVEVWKPPDAKAIAAYLKSPAPGTTLALVAGELRKDSPLAKAVTGHGTLLLWDVAARAVPKWSRSSSR